jgi:hypothetical protein
MPDQSRQRPQSHNPLRTGLRGTADAQVWLRVTRSPSTLFTPPEAPNPVDRLAELMALAHSRGGIGPWEVAELAKLRGISPWAPLRVILAKEASK